MRISFIRFGREVRLATIANAILKTGIPWQASPITQTQMLGALARAQPPEQHRRAQNDKQDPDEMMHDDKAQVGA